MSAPVSVLAARGSVWGGMVVGLVAAGVFLAFSAWVIAERIRGSRQARPGNGEDRPSD